MERFENLTFGVGRTRIASLFPTMLLWPTAPVCAKLIFVMLYERSSTQQQPAAWLVPIRRACRYISASLWTTFAPKDTVFAENKTIREESVDTGAFWCGYVRLHMRKAALSEAAGRRSPVPFTRGVAMGILWR